VRLSWAGFSLDFSRRTYIMGILNVTPDSFSDGGIYFKETEAITHALQMAEDGADIIDIGGESTRPGSEAVSLEEELKRTIPVITTLARKIRIPISIDTYKAEVARRALDAGASMVNDISGLKFDPEMPGVVSRGKVPVVIMHIRGTPKDMQRNPVYRDLIFEVLDSLREGISLALDAGISDDMILVDPGIGFGKTFAHNLEILNNLEAFTAMGKPVLVGPSRKAFIGKILGDALPEERLEGTAAAVAVSIMHGAHIVRVHDVKEMVKVAKVTDAIKFQKIGDVPQ
jgi:dihydropteroate synthase